MALRDFSFHFPSVRFFAQRKSRLVSALIDAGKSEWTTGISIHSRPDKQQISEAPLLNLDGRGAKSTRTHLKRLGKNSEKKLVREGKLRFVAFICGIKGCPVTPWRRPPNGRPQFDYLHNVSGAIP